MSRVPKFKQFKEANIVTEDSSDYMSSDFEGFKSFKPDPDGGGSNSATNTGIVEDSNESFFNENSESKDFAMSSSSSLIAPGERKGRQKSTGAEGAGQTRTVDDFRLAECLNYLHRIISRKDKEDIFQLPVTDDIAPGYSIIIAHPMDMSTMKKKIDTYAYNNIMEYRDDLVLMCENCMNYNRPDTIYYHAARKLLDFGLKLLSREKLLSMRRTVSFMRMLTSNELGFSLEGDPSDMVHDLNSSSNKQRSQHKKPTLTHPRLSLSASLLLAKTKSFSGIDRKDSKLMPPEGEDVEYEDDITSEVQELAQEAAARLAAKNQDGKMVHLRRNPNGSTGYTFLKESNSLEPSSEEEKVVTIGNLCEGLQQSSYSMSSFIEDKKNPAKPMHYLENGPFSSHAPVYDVSYSNLPKEELDILMATYGDETAYQYALSLMNFAKDTGVLFNQYVNLVLNSLSNKEHEKYIQYLAKKNQPVVKTEEPTTTAATTSVEASATVSSTTTSTITATASTTVTSATPATTSTAPAQST